MYALGVDLGTTFTAAATWRDGHAEIASLGSRAAVIPSVVLLRSDETILTGETASRRGLSEPHRVAREFKRRLGDTTPILLGGVPYSAEALMAPLLRSVVEAIAIREGGAPGAVCVSYPANWGPYKTDLLRQAVRIAGLEQPVVFATEPEAAAAFYARQQRIQPGAVVAVYDLGGGTFDAAVLRKTATGFEILGQPEGIERLGGVDFDAAVFGHVSRALAGKLEELDEDDPVAVAAVARLKEECVQAKEALSSDTDVTIAVLLPNVSTEVRLTRAELEAMVRPALHTSVEALRRALRSAGVGAEQLHSVLLVGGSSRMPIVAQLVGAELGRPVAVDAHPKHAVALGAAWLASGSLPRQQGRGVAPAGLPAGPPPPVGPRVASPPGPPPVPAGVAMPAGAPVPAGVAMPAGPPVASAPPAQVPPGVPAPFPPPAPVGGVYGSGSGTARRRRRALLASGAALVLLLGTGGLAWALLGNNGKGGSGLNQLSGSQSPGNAPSSVAPSPTTPPDTQKALPADEQCTDKIKANTRWVCLTKATFDGSKITIEYEANWAGATPNVSGGYHVHIYGGDGTTPPDKIMGTHSANRGKWYVEDKEPSVKSATSSAYLGTIVGHPKVCGRIADSGHRLVKDRDGGYTTGNCVPITRT